VGKLIKGRQGLNEMENKEEEQKRRYLVKTYFYFPICA